MKRGFAKKVIIKSQRQFMYGSNFYESDVTFTLQFQQKDFGSIVMVLRALAQNQRGIKACDGSLL